MRIRRAVDAAFWWLGKLWLLNSGTGELGHVDLASGSFVPSCFLPGYARGLAFTGDYALVGLSKARNQSFSGCATTSAFPAWSRSFTTSP